MPLRSSISKGNGGSYHYYLFQTKACENYGKSIKRDQIEGEVGDLIKSLQPTKGLIALVTAMFRRAWDLQSEQARDMRRAADRKIGECDKQIDALEGEKAGTLRIEQNRWSQRDRSKKN
ncbi:MAG: hypothetical protein ACRBBS_06855 [Thalassovita sp.]